MKDQIIKDNLEKIAVDSKANAEKLASNLDYVAIMCDIDLEEGEGNE